MVDRPGQSSWLNFLDWVKRPEQAVLAGLHGDMAGVGRNLADFALDPIDAIPGVDIPDFTTEATEYKPGGDDGSATSRVINAVAGVAANPLTYLPLVPGVRKGLGRAADTLVNAPVPRTVPGAQVLNEARGGMRRAFGWENLSEPLAAKIAAARAEQDRTVRAGMGYWKGVVEQVGNLTTAEDQALHDVIANLRFDDTGRAAAVLDPLYASPKGADIPTRTANMKARVRTWKANNPGVSVDEAKLDTLIDAYVPFAERQRLEGVGAGVLAPGQEEADYLKRLYIGMPAGSSGAGAREFRTPDEVAAFMGKNPDVSMKRSFIEAVGSRIEGQGRLLKRAKLMRDLGVDPRAAHDTLDVGESTFDDTVKNAVSASATPGSDDWHRLRFELGREDPMIGSQFDRAMQGMKKYFAPAAVYGVGPFVRIGSIVRNQLSGVMQMMTDPAARAALWRDPGQIITNLWGAIDDGLRKNFGKGRWSTGELTSSMDILEEAAKRSEGTGVGMTEWLRSQASTTQNKLYNELADAVQSGAVSGFVSSERLAGNLVRTPSAADPRYWLVPGSPGADIGAAMFQGLEDRMRLGLYLDMTRSGINPMEAAKRVKQVFLDYGVNSQGNRLLRTWFPFVQFMTQSAKQQAGFFAATPLALTGTAALFQQDDNTPIPNYVAQQTHVPIPGGVLAGGVSPAEAFNMVPDLSSLASTQRSLAAGVGGALNPLPKTLVQLGTGQELFTGRPWEPRLPGRTRQDPRNVGDSAYGIIQSLGFAQPLVGPMVQAKNVAADPGAGTVKALTGLSPVAADPLRAESDRLQAELAANPAVLSRRDYYSPSREPEALQAIRRLREVQKELADKARAAAAAASAGSGSPGAPTP